MYTKLQAERIFNGHSFLSPETVLILKNGVIENIVDEKEAGEDVQSYKGILSPGFVNAHCHIELSYMKGMIPRQTGIVPFVQQVLKLKEVQPNPESFTNAIEELHKTGTVAVGDICNTENSIPFKVQSKVHWKNFIEVSGFVEATANNRFLEGLSVQKKFIHAGLDATVVPHSPYSVSKKLMQLISEYSFDNIISIHNQESEAENEFFLKGTGLMQELYKNLGINISSFIPPGSSSLKYWHPFLRNRNIISVHNTFSGNDDIQSAKELTYCLCINANRYIENALPPVDLLLENDCKIVLGTDSLASNSSLNMYNEILSFLQFFPQIPLEKLLHWATAAGANALGFEDKLGSLKKGTSPGIVWINEKKSGLIIGSA